MNRIQLYFILLFSISVSYCTAQQETGLQTEIADTTFVNLKDYSAGFVYDMKYAHNDNFLKEAVYDCGECYLRLKTVKSLVEANKTALEKGLRIKIFDCYRPLDIQKKMWKIVPNPTYVANPERGSIHNRGGAVDLTLVSSDGTELDMGTAFDHFGPESAHQFQGLSHTVLSNRELLKSIMEQHNFSALASEWWHYNLNGSSGDPVSNFKWECD